MTKTRTAGIALTAILALGGLTACGDDDKLSGTERDKATKAALAETDGGKVTDAEKTDEDEQGDHAYEVQVSLDNGDEIDVDLDKNYEVVRTDRDANDSNSAPSTEGSAGATTGADDDAPLTGQVLAQASKAAIAAAGGGKVTDSGTSDDAGHAYEVQVTLDNGDEVDVDLDKGFKVVRKDTDRPDS